MSRKSIHNQMHGLGSVAHHLLEQLDEELAVEATLIGRIPEGSLRVDCRCSADRLPLIRPRNDRSLALLTSGFAMHGVGAKARFIPEIYFSTLSFRRAGYGWIRFALPFLNRFRIAPIGALKRFLRSKTEFDGELLLDQTGDHGPRPKAEIQTILARIFAVDPGNPLFLPARRKCARTPRRRSRPQRFYGLAGTGCDSEPLVDRGAIESIRDDNGGCPFAFSNTLDRHQAYRFKRLVVKTAPISPHDS